MKMSDISHHYKDGRPRHGSPEDRGSADRYYGRNPAPHWYPQGTYKGEEITEAMMSNSEIAAYFCGYWKETDRKEY
jgi:hypothetical protein|tara:strand:- start:378 stop:605 length:228 start_codon:yes stop_codon:yes gene_type:complete